MPQQVILIVDDSRANRATLREIFEDTYHVEESFGGIKALEAMLKKRPGIVLLDVETPDLGGLNVLRSIKENAEVCDIPVVAIVDADDEPAQIRALDMGAADVVLKPYSPRIMQVRVNNAAEYRRMQRLARQRQENYLTTRDILTGLYNRDAFCAVATERIASAPDETYTLSVFDIDHFKVINEQYGLDTGDRILKHCAQLLSEFTDQHGGVCCRLFADQFAALLPSEVLGVSRDQRLESTLRMIVEREQIFFPMMLSTGRYVASKLALPVSAMIDRAQLAKQAVKGQYDSHVAYYTESMRDQLIQEQWIISQMNVALATDQFEGWLQPQFNHAAGKLIGAEMLVRWRHPERGLISPAAFIPVFESNGFVYEIDKRIWEKACACLRKWLDMGLSDLPISVNVSRYDLFQPDFIETITGIVRKYGLERDMLRLEITETAFSTSPSGMIEVIKKLRAYNFIVEIDDFGSGYSSLNTLKDVPANILKLDMQFLASPDRGGGSEADGGVEHSSNRGGDIITSVLRMAKWLNMPVIAEGVETVEQADFLRSVGCLYVQGYFYARPMPPDEYEQLLTDSQKDRRLNERVNVESMDANAFWNPKSLETLVFNRYTGGACVFEYFMGQVDMLRVNSQYAAVFHTALTETEILRVNLLQAFSEGDGDRMVDTIERALVSGAPESVVVEYNGRYDDGVHEYIRFVIRTIARIGDRHLVYGYVENVTELIQARQRIRELESRG